MSTRALSVGLLCLLFCAPAVTGDDVPPSPEPAKARANAQATPMPPKPKPIRQKAKPAKQPPTFESFTNPAEAGPDFVTQGEYTGRVTTDGQPVWYGVQIVALGAGQFDVVIDRGGLPGNDWDGQTKLHAKTQPIEGGYRFDWQDATAELKEKTIRVLNAEGTQIGRLTKVRRSSRTLGQQPPDGAVVLFDGSSTDKLQGGVLTDDGWLQQGFSSKRTFGDFTLHAEFRTPFMPTARGQQRGNSGIYMQGRYETQILDSFGLAGKNNEAGGIYEVSDPAMNMCFPPLSWQTYDVDFTAARFDEDGHKTADARMTVKLNGVLVQDDVTVPRATRAAKLKEGPEPGPIAVQDHGNPVRFRNIWVVPRKQTPKLPPPPT